jgi:hypothetical protein
MTETVEVELPTDILEQFVVDAVTWFINKHK